MSFCLFRIIIKYSVLWTLYQCYDYHHHHQHHCHRCPHHCHHHHQVQHDDISTLLPKQSRRYRHCTLRGLSSISGDVIPTSQRGWSFTQFRWRSPVSPPSYVFFSLGKRRENGAYVCFAMSGTCEVYITNLSPAKNALISAMPSLFAFCSLERRKLRKSALRQTNKTRAEFDHFRWTCVVPWLS